ncbi:nuclear transport factor 2 family protein [Embleya sp. NPDC050154]|uniref:nuclear transport factor 2 family protein n=1 Tax=Embleya sp. NPDC050154 TaxID=3363988 RepID=UPI0037B2D423
MTDTERHSPNDRSDDSGLEGPARLDRNKRIAQDFFDLAFNDKQPMDAAAKYLGARYIQHNPHAPDGADAFVEFVTAFGARFPDLTIDFKRVLAEDDLVVVHSLMRTSREDRGSALVDIVRVRDGRIVEHWDVIQPIPETAANDNTMF